MIKISENISYDEATYSSTAIRLGINNKPSREALGKMQDVARAIFQPVRESFNTSIGITSFYRSEALNRAVGGAIKSQHILGEAIDMDGDVYGNVSNSEIFNYIKENLDFDKLIWEFGDDNNPSWVHVSYREGNNRGIILKALKEDGRTIYRKENVQGH